MSNFYEGNLNGGSYMGGCANCPMCGGVKIPKKTKKTKAKKGGRFLGFKLPIDYVREASEKMREKNGGVWAGTKAMDYLVNTVKKNNGGMTWSGVSDAIKKTKKGGVSAGKRKRPAILSAWVDKVKAVAKKHGTTYPMVLKTPKLLNEARCMA